MHDTQELLMVAIEKEMFSQLLSIHNKIKLFIKEKKQPVCCQCLKMSNLLPVKTNL